MQIAASTIASLTRSRRERKLSSIGGLTVHAMLETKHAELLQNKPFSFWGSIFEPQPNQCIVPRSCWGNLRPQTPDLPSVFNHRRSTLHSFVLCMLCISFSVSGPSLWNSLPLSVRDPSLTMTQFCTSEDFSVSPSILYLV